MDRPLTDQQKRLSQDIAGAIFIFYGLYMFLKGQTDGLTLGVLLIIGFGVSQDIRNISLFLFKYLFAKLTKSQTPSYDLSRARIVQNSKRDSIVNYGTIVYKR